MIVYYISNTLNFVKELARKLQVASSKPEEVQALALLELSGIVFTLMLVGMISINVVYYW